MNHDNALRPQTFADYIGQPAAISRLRILTLDAKTRGEPLPHCLFHGPPGLGKTTLANIIAAEMGAKAHVAMAPGIETPHDLVRLLAKLSTNDVLFIDEIHRLSPIVGEMLYPAMEDRVMYASLDCGKHSRQVPIELPPFTLVGATTQPGLLEAPLRERFGGVVELAFYSAADMTVILTANAIKLGIAYEPEAIALLASRSRGTPRVGNHLLRFARSVANVEGDGTLTLAQADSSLTLSGIDGLGLNEGDRRYLRTLVGTYKGGPAGAQALSATMGVTQETVSAVIEPYLLSQELIARTPRGRCATDKAKSHLARAA